MYRTVKSRHAAFPIYRYRLLSSWKEIAAYVGKGVRTVQRWERDHGFPVRRPNAELRGIVIAIPAEIDGWLTKNETIAMPAELDRRIQDLASNGKGGMEEELANLRAENADLRQQVAELRAQLQEAEQKPRSAN